jgi:hypothetical protein
MRQIACGLLAAGLMATTATAQAQELGSASFLKQARLVAADLARSSSMVAAQAAPANEPPPVKITGGIDFPSLYMFRGIRQEGDPSFTTQPFVNLAFAATPAMTVNVGSWNSFHTGSTKDGPGAFYESDFYVSGAFATGNVTTTALYTAYTSPVDAFGTVHELAFTVGFNDSENSVPMAPAVTLAFELGDNGADGPNDKGIYLELAATPAIPMGDDAPLTLTVPIKLGLSLKDYYQLADENGELQDNTFGYFSIGLMALKALSPNFDIHGGVLVYALGDNLKIVNNGDSAQVVGTIGLGFSF